MLEYSYYRVYGLNDERSHAGPLTLDIERDRFPALADATGWATLSSSPSEKARKVIGDGKS
jgi:hypothetical protein